MMEFKIAMKEMKDVVKKIDKSVVKKASFPILETVLVKQENGQLAFIASNTEEELHIYKNVLVTGNDSFCIALDNLKKIVKLKADVITITYDSEDKKILVSTGKKIVSFVSEWDITSFPLMYIKEPEETWFISRYTSFYEMMEKLSVYLEDADENYKAMTCYNFNIAKNRIVALDDHRMGVCNPSENIGKFNNDSELKEINLKRTFWIKLKNCIAKEVNGEQNTISMASAENKTYITGNDFMMIVRNVDVMYFNVDGMILNELDLMMVSISTKELKESAEYNVTLYDKDHRKPMYMKFSGNDVMSYMKSQTEESFDRITLTENGVDDGFMIGFNPRFIKDLCNGIDTEFARMGFRNAKSPVMAYDGDFTYLVLPVNINACDVSERIDKLMKVA